MAYKGTQLYNNNALRLKAVVNRVEQGINWLVGFYLHNEKGTEVFIDWQMKCIHNWYKSTIHTESKCDYMQNVTQQMEDRVFYCEPKNH